MSPDLYAYEQSGRRPIVIAAMMLSAGFVVAAIAFGAPWYVYLPALTGCLLSIWEIAANKVSGCKLQEAALFVYATKWSTRFAVDEIQALQVTQWSDGAPALVLITSHAQPFTIPSGCVGSAQKFMAACEAKGIKILRTN